MRYERGTSQGFEMAMWAGGIQEDRTESNALRIQERQKRVNTCHRTGSGALQHQEDGKKHYFSQ